MPTPSPRSTPRTNKVVANIPIGQAPQAITYVPGAAPNAGRPAESATASALPARSRTSTLGAGRPAKGEKPPTSVSLFDQGLIQVLQASVSGLQPKQRYVLALSDKSRRDRSGAAARRLHDQPGGFGHRQCGRADPADRAECRPAERRYLVIAPGEPTKFGDAVQVQAP